VALKTHPYLPPRLDMGRAILYSPYFSCIGVSQGDIYLFFYLDFEVRKTKNYPSE
jgi:hypothetical protein